ncbi:hypothetical protein GJAV_G00206180 [Gymnothorax javanicus]|nr:hypothetical protein GJAV_G00206180 [Gymnothorax javanicus]
MPIGPDEVQVGVAQFTNASRREIDLNAHRTKDSLLAAVSQLRLRGGTQPVNIGAALDFVRTQMLRADKGSRINQGVPQLLVVLSAKKSSDSVAQPAQELHRLGVLTMAAGSKNSDEQDLKRIAFDPTLVFSVNDFRKLLHKPKMIIAPLSTLSGAVITEQPTEPTIIVGERDVIFLIDGSKAMGSTQFNAVRQFIIKFIKGMPIGPDKVQVGVAQFTNATRLEMDLNAHSTKGSLLAAVSRLRLRGGTQPVNIGAALDFVRTQMLRADKGSRINQGVPQLLVVLSAKKSSDSVAQPAQELHRLGVLTMAAGSKNSDEQDLKQIAFDPILVFSVNDFRKLLHKPKMIIAPLSTLSGAVITEQPTEPSIIVGERDVIFLIDGSKAMGSTQFNAVRQFIIKFIKGMPIGPDKVQVGVAQFTNATRLEMDLNAHSTKGSLLAAVSRLRLRGGTQPVNIGAALDFVRTQMLRADKGSRINRGVPQLLVVLSAKKSSDSVAQPAQELHRLGVLTMAAGSKNSDEQDLKQIAFDPTLVFSVKDFRKLFSKPKMIIASLSTLSGVFIFVEITTVETQRIIRDIVFLVDGSDYVGEAGFAYVRDFISRIVNQLDVRPDRVQIALMQFARDQRTEFYLNSHNNKQDVLDAVSGIRPMGGNVVNTGAALEYALANHFQRQAGSRKRQRVPQAAVLITGGPAQDEVKPVADKVAVEGVLTYTVGTGQADNSLLATVAFVPDLAYYVSTFDGLPNVVEEIMTLLITVELDTSTNITEVELTGDERDMAFLVDGTDTVGRDFRYIQDFILNVIEPLDVGADKVRVAVVQHSENPSPNFYLDTYKTKDEVTQAIRTMRLAGGRTLNTGEALNFMRNMVFSPERGSRVAQNVPQYLIVLSAGRSRDAVAGPAGALKTEGVLPFGVGVRDADISQISAISYNPAFTFTVRDFDQLNTVQQRLGSYVGLSTENLQTVIE